MSKNQEALDRFKLAAEAIKLQRDRETEDLSFQVPEKQWPKEVADSRKGQVIAGITIQSAPMLSIPKLDQPIQLILNGEKSAHLGVQVHALSEDATDDTAETIQGLYRHIETDSRANLARSWGFERGVKAGLGGYRIDKVQDHASDNHSDQKIVIKRILHQESLYFDPFAQEPDFRDGEYAFVTAWIPYDRYKRKYKDSSLAAYDESQLNDLAEAAPMWVKGDGPGRAVLIAEYFRKEFKTRKAIRLDDGSTALDDEIPEGRTAMGGKDAWSLDVQDWTLKWSTINGCGEEIEPEQEWDGKWIPLVPVIGRELIPFDNERRWVGVIGPNKDGQRMFNYAASKAVQLCALEPNIPWMMVEGQEEGHEEEFGLSNVRQFPYLRYRNVSLNGTPAPPPQRVQIDASRLGPAMLLLQQADQFLHAGTGAFEPTLGQDSSTAKSGKQVLALQQQHDQGNSNFLDNLAEISLTYEAMVIVDLMPHVYDRPGRVARILDGEDNPQTVMLNQPFITDPNSGRPMPAPPEGQPQGQNAPKVKHFDLKKGRYGVTVSVGKSWESRVQQGNDQLGQLLMAVPGMMPILGWRWLKFQEWPGAKEAAEDLKKMRPPQLQDDQNDPQQLQQAIAQAKQENDQLKALLGEASQKIQTDQVKVDGQIQIKQIDADASLKLQAMKDATSIAVAEINAQTKGLISAQEAQHEAIALNMQITADAQQAEQDRQHQAALGAQDQAGTAQQSAQDAAQQAALAEQGQAHTLEQGEQGQAHALQQGEQSHAHAVDQVKVAAKVAPKPKPAGKK